MMIIIHDNKIFFKVYIFTCLYPVNRTPDVAIVTLPVELQEQLKCIQYRITDIWVTFYNPHKHCVVKHLGS